MMDHGQLSPPTPAALSRTSSLGESSRGRRNSAITGLRMSRVDDQAAMSPKEEQSNSRKSSLSGGLAGTLKLTPLSEGDLTQSSSGMSSDLSCPTSEAPQGREASLSHESALYDSDEDKGASSAQGESPAEVGETSTSLPPQQAPILSSGEISTQLPSSLAALRRSSLEVALKTTASGSMRSSPNSVVQSAPPLPILVNPVCSGYFVEPVRSIPPS